MDTRFYRTLLARLSAPVAARSVAYFRVVFAAAMIWQVSRTLFHGYVTTDFAGKAMHFTYWPFSFLQPWPEPVMYVHLVLTALAALVVGWGAERFYRPAAIFLFASLAYFFLIEQANYLNHAYLVVLLSFLLIFVPPRNTGTTPALWLWLLRFQLALPYFFGGLAKFTPDWLLGEPLRAWLAVRTDFPLVGELFTNQLVVFVMTYGALLFDTFVVFLLLSRRTRVFAYIIALAFHFTNSGLFDIGIFPWLMMAGTAIFFPPEWPRRVWEGLKARDRWTMFTIGGGFLLGTAAALVFPKAFSPMHIVIGGLSCAIAAFHLREPFSKRDEPKADTAGDAGAIPQWVWAGVVVWVVIQLVVPLRHFAIPGNVHWTDEGHDFSWHMKLRDKDCVGRFYLTDRATGESWYSEPTEHLSRRQEAKMLSRPHLIIEYAKWLARQQRGRDMEGRANIVCSLNGRPPQTIVYPLTDLTQESYPWWGHADWIAPLEVPLPPPRPHR